MEDGHIAERGTYEELMAKNGAFARFQREFGSKEEVEEEGEKEEEAIEAEGGKEKEKVAKEGAKAVQGKAIMQIEERNTGAISGSGMFDLFRLIVVLGANVGGLDSVCGLFQGRKREAFDPVAVAIDFVDPGSDSDVGVLVSLNGHVVIESTLTWFSGSFTGKKCKGLWSVGLFFLLMF